jgi:hypothetical protein
VKCYTELKFSLTFAKEFQHFLELYCSWFCLDGDRLVMAFSMPFNDRLSAEAAVIMFPDVKIYSDFPLTCFIRIRNFCTSGY